jgi:hypothetical protein
MLALHQRTIADAVIRVPGMGDTALRRMTRDLNARMPKERREHMMMSKPKPLPPRKHTVKRPADPGGRE